MATLKTKRAHVETYLRPSENALPGRGINKRGQDLKVYPSIKGWFEVRVADEAGRTHAEFIRRKDVKNKLKFFTFVLWKKIKAKLK